MTDEELVALCIRGNHEAQRELWNRFSRKMMSVCMRYVGNKNDAEDVLQEGFIKAFQNLKQWKGDGPLGGWMRSIMVNTALTHLRKQQRWNMESGDIERVEQPSDEMDAMKQMQEQEIIQLIASMPAGYRTVFNLYAIEGYAHQEIAMQLSISESTSKTQFLKARNWIQKRLTKKELEQDAEK
jgi:RNA polymerase sigma factor (sigma-70 family)